MSKFWDIISDLGDKKGYNSCNYCHLCMACRKGHLICSVSNKPIKEISSICPNFNYNIKTYLSLCSIAEKEIDGFLEEAYKI